MTDQSAYQLLRQVVGGMTAAGELFETTEATVRDRRMRVWKNAPPTMRDFWLSSRQFGPRDYLIFERERLSYEQAHEAVERVANALLARGIRQHDRVAIAMRNYPEWLLAYWAIICIGAVPVGVNAWWVSDELAYGLKDSESRMLICDVERLQRFESIRDQFTDMAVITVRVAAADRPDGSEDWARLLEAPAGMPEATIDPEDDACIFYTSGTTGRPKGAQLSHRGCTSNAMTMVFFGLAQAIAQAYARGETPPDPTDPNAPQSGTIAATPLFHVTANNCLAHGMTATGGKIVHMYKWDAGQALEIIESEKISGFSGVPTMAREIINHPAFKTTDTSSLQTLAGGGAAVPADLVGRIVEQGEGAMPSQGYGMTELCGIAVGGAGIFLAGKPDSTGFVSPVLDLKIVDPEGNQVAQGERGEVCIYGPQVITGYLNRPDATADTIVDGWLHTGDVGYLDDDGFLYLVDRLKEMVIRGGENVYCLEVETALYRNEGVAECSVFGVPDERLGEEVGAAIFPREGVQLDAKQLRETCAAQLAAYKVPRFIWVVDEPLPRNANGKFVKKLLRERLNTADAD